MARTLTIFVALFAASTTAVLTFGVSTQQPVATVGTPLADVATTPPPDVDAEARRLATRHHARPVAEPVRPTDAPRSITIPAIGVASAVVPVGLEPDGSMEIPHDVHEVGWYEPLGVRPGDPGTAVLAGHVDDRDQGRGAFFDLRELDVGDEVIVAAGDTEQRWRVDSRTTYAKDALPIDALFVTQGAPRLVLITCGGSFDPGQRSYTDNIVVEASPVGPASP